MTPPLKLTKAKCPACGVVWRWPSHPKRRIPAAPCPECGGVLERTTHQSRLPLRDHPAYAGELAALLAPPKVARKRITSSAPAVAESTRHSAKSAQTSVSSRPAGR